MRQPKKYTEPFAESVSSGFLRSAGELFIFDELQNIPEPTQKTLIISDEGICIKITSEKSLR